MSVIGCFIRRTFTKMYGHFVVFFAIIMCLELSSSVSKCFIYFTCTLAYLITFLECFTRSEIFRIVPSVVKHMEKNIVKFRNVIVFSAVNHCV